jgi:hypothetical protein
VVAILEIRPFYLHMMPEEDAHLCPVVAVADWINASGITQGYLFHRMASGDHIIEKDAPMVGIVTILHKQ